MDDLDHRMLGESLDLFHFEEEAPGAAFWHPRGHDLFRTVEEYMRRRVRRDGYGEIRTPVLLPRSLWERSGHWQLYGQNMFAIDPDGKRPMAVKPMNCPGHVQVFRHGVRSWRDLPMRFAEFGICHRDEPSGSLHGLMRLRGFVQDDGHIFCLEEQVGAEVSRFCALLASVYADFGFSDIKVGLSLRPDVRAGSGADWDRAESLLAAAASVAGLSPEAMPGEGAFYGPKLEFALLDRHGRRWQCGTLQLDLILPGLLGATFRDAADGKAPPVLLHRAVLGSLERFIGILLEHHGGDLPPWLAPEQALVAAVTDRHAGHAGEVTRAMAGAGIRVRLAAGSERLGARVREAGTMRIPVLAVVGDKEMADGSVTLRMDGKQRELPLLAAVADVRVALLAAGMSAGKGRVRAASRHAPGKHGECLPALKAGLPMPGSDRMSVSRQPDVR